LSLTSFLKPSAVVTSSSFLWDFLSMESDHGGNRHSEENEMNLKLRQTERENKIKQWPTQC
jgi:hypothetical protein